MNTNTSPASSVARTAVGRAAVSQAAVWQAAVRHRVARPTARMGAIWAAGLILFAALMAPPTGLHHCLADEPPTWQRPPCPWNLSALGVTRRGTPIPYWHTADDLDLATPRSRVLVVCGGDAASALYSRQISRALVDWFAALPENSPGRKRVALSVVPCLLPDVLAAPPAAADAEAISGRDSASRKASTAKGDANTAGSDRFPPQGPAYLSESAPEAAYLWRWLGMFAPDLVVELRSGANVGWSVSAAIEDGAGVPGRAQGTDATGPKGSLGVPLSVAQRTAWRELAKTLRAKVGGVPEDSLVAALPRIAPAEVGAIPAFRYTIALIADPPPSKSTSTAENLDQEKGGAGERITAALAGLFDALPSVVPQPSTNASPPVSPVVPSTVPSLAPSPARAELRRRVERSPRKVAELLAKHYGHSLPQVEYIPAVAMMGRLRLAEALSREEKTAERAASTAAVLADLEWIAAPFVEGRQSAEPKSGSGQSGHLLFAALADHWAGRAGADVSKRRDRYRELVVAAANQAFGKDGLPLPSMPFHAEMSDAVFMGGPILAAAGRLTGERRYFDAALRHFDFMGAKVIRPDGLYRHSPLDEAAWGRGNGFPALGLALMISEWPLAEPGRDALIAAHRRHLAALLPHQDPAGEWRQVVDRPESYRELTATCMITFALMRGIRLGWLDRDAFSPAAERGWRAILTRVADDGRLVDVCTGTGKQNSLRAYYDREALLGRDPRGGAMALLAATEKMWERSANREPPAREK
ncbi:MAG: glycoside hydrolase family 88 protein [Planctomycetota bacterium]